MRCEITFWVDITSGKPATLHYATVSDGLMHKTKTKTKTKTKPKPTRTIYLDKRWHVRRYSCSKSFHLKIMIAKVTYVVKFCIYDLSCIHIYYLILLTVREDFVNKHIRITGFLRLLNPTHRFCHIFSRSSSDPFLFVDLRFLH